MTGAEIVTVRYGEDQLTPESKKGSRPGQGNGGGSGPPQRPDGDRRPRTSSYLGEGGRDRYRALSDGARDRFRDLMRQRVESMPNASMEEQSVFAKREFEKIEAEDRRSRR